MTETMGIYLDINTLLWPPLAHAQERSKCRGMVKIRHIDRLFRRTKPPRMVCNGRWCAGATSGKPAVNGRNRSCAPQNFRLTLVAMEKMIIIAGWWWAR
ncbi:hypothetical protein GB927_013655 [Shinella sp. CPCC 100929]|uniref:Uncharacterized protein n=1 Tax=Shinella lacus TaxID=2654216 RepID=A0ABT1R7C8_9HYPH|nr:hypothetical protein [Shinella lacus]MCQ4631093.1 hypothetical protein [Shinella lacus]